MIFSETIRDDPGCFLLYRENFLYQMLHRTTFNSAYQRIQVKNVTLNVTWDGYFSTGKR